MKLSDYIAQFLAEQGVRHVFAITGGASVHMIDSLAKRTDIDYICPHHEQAGAMAADAYARMTGRLGAAISTSGPGATNMITGICSSYYDSVPVLYITGQVSTFRFKDGLGVRQVGFQETDIVPMCAPVTKYAVRLEDPKQIRFELEKAVHIAFSGRPGPVLIDIPDNLQREDIDPEILPRYEPENKKVESRLLPEKTAIKECLKLLRQAERPVLILGWGVRLAGAAKEALNLVNRLGIPILLTWGVRDLLPTDHPLMAGSFGTHGSRYGNFTVQNADFILSIGSRLDTHETGSPLSSFAREAKMAVVDIDAGELGKFPAFGKELDLSIQADAGAFIETLLQHIPDNSQNDFQGWLDKIDGWKKKFPVCSPEFYEEKSLNPYVFVDRLSEASQEGEVFLIDTGCAIAWMMQGFRFKKDQRAFHAFNNTPMGYALPGSVGASLALDKGRVCCVVGDGGFQMNIQELSTVLHHGLPIKIFLINNHGYSMIQQTQEQWLDAKYEASSFDGGLGFPDFVAVAEAYGYKTVTIETNAEAAEKISEVMRYPGPVFCNVEINSTHRVIPQVKYGRPIEDSEPLIPRADFKEAMVVAPMPQSAKME